MAFTVEDGTGLANANAYITKAEFVAYWADRNHNLTSSNAQQEAAIVKATDYVENRFRTKFKGNREFATQALSFPRTKLYDSDGQLVEGLPTRLKNAIAEYAHRALSAELATDPTFEDNGLLLKSTKEKVGPIEEEKHYLETGTIMIYKPYPSADALLEEYISKGSNSGSVIR